MNFLRFLVCFGLYIDKTCVPDVFSESPLNTDTRIIRTLWHVPLVSVLTGFHCKWIRPVTRERDEHCYVRTQGRRVMGVASVSINGLCIV